MPGIFVDSNVLLRVGQPDPSFLHEASLRFLEAHRGVLYVGVVVHREVQYQITHFSGRYPRIPDIKHWLYVGCTKLPDEEKAEAIEELQLAYAARGWRGEPGDTGDRIHAGTATLFEIPYLATWEARFLQQQDLINAVNADQDLKPLRLMRPDWPLTWWWTACTILRVEGTKASMDIREERATAYEEPTTDESPPLAEELRQMSFRAFMERSNRQFEEDRAECLAEEAEAREEQKH